MNNNNDNGSGPWGSGGGDIIHEVKAQNIKTSRYG